MTFTLTKTVTHMRLTAPVVQTVDIQARDLKHALERLTVSNEHICNLRNSSETSWQDSRGATITLTLKEKIYDSYDSSCPDC